MRHCFNKTNNLLPRLSALLLSFVIAFAATACASSSSNDGVSENDENKSSVSAGVADSSQISTEKEEVVYANLTADGLIEEVYVVNIFGAGEVTDYGAYSEVEMLNTSDEITKDGDKITFTATASRTYYEGILENAELPWDISIKYYIDGKEYSPEDAAGMSGSLKIKFSVSENEKCETAFFDSYAVQASFSLDTEKFSNITAKGATAANVGSNRQLTYTILPGEGIDTEITAEVKDFEMESVSINGVPLSMSLDIDYSELTDLVSKLTEAIDAINSGAGELSDGTGSLYSGIEQIEDALSQLNANSDTLTSGSSEVLAALKQIQSALSAVSADTDEINQLVEGSAQIAEGLSQVSEGAAQLSAALSGYKEILLENGLDLDYLQSMNQSAGESLDSINKKISEYKTQIDQLESQLKEKLKEILQDKFPDLDIDIDKYTGQIEEIITSLNESLENLEILINADYAAINGMESYIEQVAASAAELSMGAATLAESYSALDEGINTLAEKLSGLLENLSTLKSAIDTLVSEYSKLDSGIDQYTDAVAQILAGYGAMVNGAKQLQSGSETLSEGTGELFEETDGMDSEITDRIDEMIEGVTGGDFDVVSFVSEKNKNVSMVQFAFKTAAVAKTEALEEETEPSDDGGLWDRITDLFK